MQLCNDRIISWYAELPVSAKAKDYVPLDAVDDETDESDTE